VSTEAGALDAAVDLDAVVHAVRGDAAVVLRAQPALETSSDASYGPQPKRPTLIALASGERTVKIDGGKDVSVRAVELTSRPLTWGVLGGKAFERGAASIALELEDGTKLSVVDVVAEDEAAAAAMLAPVRAALEARLGLEPSVATVAPTDPATRALGATTLLDREARRFSMRLEGDRFVLRDFESVGPRAGAFKYRVIAIAALVFGAVAWWQFYEAFRASSPLSSLLGLAAVGIVLLVAAFAMNEIARFAAKYVADNEPLAWLSDDHVVVAPWVSRQGAIDLRPEGRYGAAIKIAEVNAVTVREHDGKHAVTLETEHGAIDVLYTDDLAAANLWRGALERALIAVAAPTKRAIPLLRARTTAAA